MRKGIADQLMPPRHLLDRIAASREQDGWARHDIDTARQAAAAARAAAALTLIAVLVGVAAPLADEAGVLAHGLPAPEGGEQPEGDRAAAPERRQRRGWQREHVDPAIPAATRAGRVAPR